MVHVSHNDKTAGILSEMWWLRLAGKERSWSSWKLRKLGHVEIHARRLPPYEQIWGSLVSRSTTWRFVAVLGRCTGVTEKTMRQLKVGSVDNYNQTQAKAALEVWIFTGLRIRLQITPQRFLMHLNVLHLIFYITALGYFHQLLQAVR